MSQYGFATKAVVQQPLANFLVEYLVKSFGFSKTQAISTSNKVNLWKSTKKNPDLVVNFFQEMGLNKTQIKTLISSYPRLLFFDPEKILKPKVQVLQDLGLSGSDLVKVIMAYKSVFGKGLDNHIRPCIHYWRELLGGDANVALALKKHIRLLDYYVPRKMEEMIVLLRDFGFSNDNVMKFILRNSREILLYDAEFFLNVLHRVEHEFRIPRESAMFYYGFEVLSKLGKSAIEVKFDILRSFGWTDADAHEMFRNLPSTLGISKARMMKTLDFFVKELGYTPDYMASHPMLFCLNVDKRVKPRYEVFKLLNETKLNKRRANLYTILCSTESKFVKEYLLPYKDKLPDLYKSYMRRVGKQKTLKL